MTQVQTREGKQGEDNTIVIDEKIPGFVSLNQTWEEEEIR